MVIDTGSTGGPGSEPTSTTSTRALALELDLTDSARPPGTVDDAFLAGMVRASVNPYAVLDGYGVVRFVSDPIVDILGIPAAECVGRSVMDFIVPEHQLAVATAIAEFVDPHRDDAGWTGPPISVELRHADGRSVPCRVLGIGSGRPGFDGVVVRIRQTATATMLDKAMAGMVTSDDLPEVLGLLLSVLGEQMPGSCGVIGLDWDGTGFARTVHAPGAPWFGADALPLDGTDLPWAGAITDGVAGEACVADLPDHVADVATAAGFAACWTFPIRLASTCENVLVVWRRMPGPPTQHLREATERMVQLIQLAFTAHASRQALEHQARTDPLTGLANRLALFDRLEALSTSGEAVPVGVLYCDLDDFKPINDRFGHGTGDRVLTIAAHRISSQVRSGDLVARLGGDEFAVLCVGADEGRLAGLARRVLRSFEEPVMIDGQSVHVGISVGSAQLGLDRADRTPSSLLHEADAALLAAKAAGKGMWRAAT